LVAFADAATEMPHDLCESEAKREGAFLPVRERIAGPTAIGFPAQRTDIP
jgi:hypothetical protein